MAALNEMQPDCHLWFAFQPNTLKDYNSELPPKWPQMIDGMKTRLMKHFYVPNLSHNLRNSSEVFTMTEVIKNNQSDVVMKDSLGVTTVAMTIHATIPKLIPINGDKHNMQLNNQTIAGAILFAVEKTRCEIGEPKSSFVVLHGNSFKTEELFNSILTK